jgi:xylulokinase
MALYLGLDSSTQSLTAVAIRLPERKIFGTWSVNFETRLPHWETENGVLPGEDPRVKHSPPLMWVEALDLLFGDMTRDGFPFGEVKAVAGSGQQHGSVYLAPGAEPALGHLAAAETLRAGLEDIFTRATSPIWMDSSTNKECGEITEAAGGVQALAELTGSAAFERFTGPQIRKFFLTEPEAYQQTWRIHLVSSFMASVLAGRSAPIDPGDGAGMNLMDITARTWAPVALAATADGLAAKLPPIAPSDVVFAAIGPYFVKRYGFAEDTKLLPWSGDNPNSLIGVGLVEQGKVAISLGTSDTYFGFMPEARVDPAAEGHVFGSPTGHYMSLICFINGSLARERIRDGLGMDWNAFSRALEAEPPGNRGRIILPYFDPEITPKVLEPGARRYRLDEGDPANVRAVVEAQAVSMAVHSAWMGVKTRTIHATGGASANRAILGVLADVNDAEVYQFEVTASAALGAALRACHGDLKAQGRAPAWPEVVAGFAEPDPGTRVKPRAAYRERYEELKRLYRACEDHALRGGPDPTADLERFGEKYGAA